MFEKLNNIWVLLIAAILLIAIIKKIFCLNKPFDEDKFIKQLQNQEKLKDKLSLNGLKTQIPNLTSYYVGLH